MIHEEGSKLSASARRQAARWVARRALAAAQDEAAFAAWLAQDPRHAAAYRIARKTWSDLARMGDFAAYRALLGAPTWRERLVARVRRWRAGHRGGRIRPGVMAATAAALLVALVSTAWILRPAMPEANTTMATRIAEIRELPLPDGSVVTLGARSRMTLAFSATGRRIRLEAGEAFFSVAKDPHRPFIVEVDGTQVRAVGTQFDVHKGPQSVRVAVLEGIVEVAPSHPRRSLAVPRQLVSAGEAIVASADASRTEVSPIPPARLAEWRRGRLVYNGASLLEVVADANRYSRRPIRIADPRLAGLRVTTSFRAEQIDEMLETLSLALPLRVRHLEDGTVLLNADQAPGAPANN